jgi:transposase-like protein
MIIVTMRYSNDTRKIAVKLLLEDNKNIEEVSGLLGIYDFRKMVSFV